MVAALVAAWLLLSAAACAPREQDFYDFKAVNIRGKLVSLEKYRGSVSVHSRGLGATPAGTDGAPRGPSGCSSEGLLPPQDTALASPPPPGHFPGGAAPPMVLGVHLATTWHAPACRETRNSCSRRQFPSWRLWAASPDLSQRLDAPGPAFVMHEWKKQPQHPAAFVFPIPSFGIWNRRSCRY